MQLQGSRGWGYPEKPHGLRLAWWQTARCLAATVWDMGWQASPRALQCNLLSRTGWATRNTSRMWVVARIPSPLCRGCSAPILHVVLLSWGRATFPWGRSPSTHQHCLQLASAHARASPCPSAHPQPTGHCMAPHLGSAVLVLATMAMGAQDHCDPHTRGTGCRVRLGSRTFGAPWQPQLHSQPGRTPRHLRRGSGAVYCIWEFPSYHTSTPTL